MTVLEELSSRESLRYSLIEFSSEVAHWFGLGLPGVDTQDWAAFMPEDELGMPPGSKLTLPLPPKSSTS